jgi:hypothetical protein
VRLTAVTLGYEGAVALRTTRQGDHALLELAWAKKTETVFTDSGAVWSVSVVDGPGIDRLPVLPDGMDLGHRGDLSVTFPATLGQRRNTVRSTGPGAVSGTKRHNQPLDSQESLATS